MSTYLVYSITAIGFYVSVFTISCNPSDSEIKNRQAIIEQAETKPDMAQIKAEIQALNTAWAEAVNTKDAATIMNLYADDAISMPDGAPALVGKAAIQKDVEASAAESSGNIAVTYITEDVFGDNERVTETGKVIATDPTGKVAYTEKYMQIWEKRNDQWQVIREIYNHDAPQK